MYDCLSLYRILALDNFGRNRITRVCDTLESLQRVVTRGDVKETLRNFTVFRAALYKKALSSKFTVVLLFLVKTKNFL